MKRHSVCMYAKCNGAIQKHKMDECMDAHSMHVPFICIIKCIMLRL
jgi:hypothetical protein